MNKRNDCKEKMKEILMKKKPINGKTRILVISIVCVLAIALALIFTLGDGKENRRKAQKLSQDVEKEIDNIKSDIPKMDRDIFVTVDDKVIVGFVEFPNNKTKYPIINVFNEHTFNSSFCRQGENMPWDLEGMTIYGTKSFTKELDKVSDGYVMIFEDLAGKKYQYKYQKNPKEQVIDYGIKIFTVDKEGNEKECYQFVRK